MSKGKAQASVTRGKAENLSGGKVPVSTKGAAWLSLTGGARAEFAGEEIPHLPEEQHSFPLLEKLEQWKASLVTMYPDLTSHEEVQTDIPHSCPPEDSTPEELLVPASAEVHQLL